MKAFKIKWVERVSKDGGMSGYYPVIRFNDNISKDQAVKELYNIINKLEKGC
jgi:hypothetical protein